MPKFGSNKMTIFGLSNQKTAYQCVEKLPQSLAGPETLFINNDIITDERLNKQRQSLLELSISGRHHNHYL